MRQIENRTFGMDRGPRKIKAANKIMFASRAADKAKKIAAQNAYRRACGLPEIKSP